MEKRLYFLKKDGWHEAEIPGLPMPDEKLSRWAYAMMDKHGYRNYMITENKNTEQGTPNVG